MSTEGTFPCGGCSYCTYMLGKSHLILPSSESFILNHFANWRTQGVMYMITCDCRSFYVGKTKQELWQRLYWHIRRMQTCNPNLPLDRHVTKAHGGKFPIIKVTALDRINIPPRKGNLNKILLQTDQRWIYKLKATFPSRDNWYNYFSEGICFEKNQWIFKSFFFSFGC